MATSAKRREARAARFDPHGTLTPREAPQPKTGCNATSNATSEPSSKLCVEYDATSGALCVLVAGRKLTLHRDPAICGRALYAMARDLYESPKSKLGESLANPTQAMLQAYLKACEHDAPITRIDLRLDDDMVDD